MNRQQQYIADAWRGYRKHHRCTAPDDTEAVRTHKRAFYAGASALIMIISAGVSEDGEDNSAEEDCVMENIALEIEDFVMNSVLGRS